MNRRGLVFVIIVFMASVLGQEALCQRNAGQPERKDETAVRKFDNSYLSMTIRPGWRVADSGDQRLSLIRGDYLLYVNPIFTHASGIEGGRFGEIMNGMPSVDAVMRNVDQPAGGPECSQSDRTVVNESISLTNLYTDSSKSDNECNFPDGKRTVWFGSFFSGTGSGSDYSVTLAYNSDDVNRLPARRSPQLRQIFSDAVAMLKTLNLKPPVEISRISPNAAPPGATVTIYGRGFRIPNFTTAVVFNDHPNTSMSRPAIAQDEASLTFEVPPSLDTMSCRSGSIEVGEACVPTPPDHIDVNDCPAASYGRTNFCGIPTPAGTYQISVTLEGEGISSNSVPFTVTPPAPRPVSILLMYPTQIVSAGDTITVRGSGFTSTGNTVKIGSALVERISSADGKTLTFPAPALSEDNFRHGIRRFKASILNANGESNAIFFAYR